MKALLHCGRSFSAEELDDIKEMVLICPSLSRFELAQTMAENWEWKTPSGRLKVAACTKLLEKMAALGQLSLPAKKTRKPFKKSAIQHSKRTDPALQLSLPLSTLGPITLQLLLDRDSKWLFNEYIDRYHYLGYKRPFGYTARYFVRSEEHLLGCILIAGASKALGARDHWIGWSDEHRLNNLPWIVNQTRFLIFPWVKIPHLGSHALGLLSRSIPRDWANEWGYTPLLMETFVDPSHYRGTVYRAANWIELGQTTGDGMVRPGKAYRTSPKLIFVYPLRRHYRKLLCSDMLNTARR